MTIPDAARTPRLLGEVSRPLVMAMVGVMAFAAQAETITYNDNATVETALALTEDTEISVASGKTVVYTNGAAISGAFKLTKSGGGTLKLATANTFTGGLVINEGFVFAQNAGALGDNAITVNGDGTKDCQLVFDCQDAVFANKVTVTGSSGTKPAIGFYRPGSTTSIPGATLSGNITATGDLGIRDYDGVVGGESTAQSWIMGKITGAICAEGQTVHCGPCGNFYFSGAVTAATLRVRRDISGYRGILHLGSNANKIGTIKHACCRINCEVANALGSAVVQLERDGNADWNCAYRSSINVFGRNQTVTYLSKADDVTTLGGYDEGGGGKGSTLTILGIPGANEVVTSHKLFGQVALWIGSDKLNYYYFCQTFTNVEHTTSGQLTTKRGGLKLAGTTTFRNVQSLNINYNSRIIVASTEAEAFKAVNYINLGAGEIIINDGVSMPFTDWKISMDSNGQGTMRIPEGETLCLSAAKLSGVYQPAGRWTKDTCKYCKVTGDGVLCNLGTAIWSGAGETEATSEIANWKDSSNPTFEYKGNSLLIPSEATKKTLEFAGVNYLEKLTATGTVVTVNGADDTAKIVLGTGGLKLGTDTKLVLNIPVEVANDTLIAAAESSSTLVIGNQAPTSLQVPNGKLVMASTATLPERFTLIQIADSSALSFEGDTKEVVVTTLKFGNTIQYDGDYTFGSTTVKVRGGYAPTTPTTTAVWDGGAGTENTALDEATNWDGDEAPAFNNVTRLVFAKAGTKATVAKGEVVVNSLVITNAAETAAEGPTSFTLEGATSDPDDTMLTVFESIYTKQTITQMKLKNITLATPYHIDQGNAAYKGDRTMLIDGIANTATYPLQLDNAIVEKPLCLSFSNAGNEINAASGYNVIRGNYYHYSSKWGNINVANGATLVFMNGVTAGWKFNWNGTGTLVISNRPWYATNAANGTARDNLGKVVFGAKGNYFGDWNSNGSGAGFQSAVAANMDKVLEFTVDDAFNHKSEISMTFNNANTSHMHVELHGTRQQMSGFYSTSLGNGGVPTTNWIHGDDGSELWVSNCITRATTNYLHVTGGAGIRSSGLGLYALAMTSAMVNNNYRIDHTSTGRLRVDGGTLYLGPGVSWRNGPVEVASTGSQAGTLKFSENNQLGRHQRLDVIGSGVLDIPENVTVLSEAVYLDGNQLDMGEYKANDGSQIGSHITGAGTLKVGLPGTTFIIK